MMRFKISLLLSCLFLAVLAEPPSPPVPGVWKLTLNENFDSFDRSKWSTKLETSKLTLGRSKCFFLDDNVFVENGNLIIETKKEKLKLQDRDGKFRKAKYSSGFVHNFRNFSQKYGYFEARMKLPQVKGLWPAFWLMPDRSLSADTPFQVGLRSIKIEESSFTMRGGKGMEIDVMEYLTEWKGKKVHHAAHWGGYKKDLKSYRTYSEIDISKGFHKFGLLWQKDLLVWFIDDKEVHRWENKRISDVPMYTILSTNVGGWATRWIQKKKLPDYTYVDYVRVWQLEN